LDLKNSISPPVALTERLLACGKDWQVIASSLPGRPITYPSRHVNSYSSLSSLSQHSIAYVLVSGGVLVGGGQTILTDLIACRGYYISFGYVIF
jgi:hypothetical protein